MKRFKNVLLMLLFALPAIAEISALHWRGSRTEWRHDAPCLAEVEAKDDCVEMRDGRRVCRHVLSEESSDEITIEWKGRVLHRWKVDFGLGGANETAHFYRADLDGDGAPELILSTLEAVSNGYAIRTVKIDIIDGFDAENRPLHFEVEEFDPKISFLRAHGSKACRVFATEWRWSKDDKRDWGHYLVGEWLDYRRGGLRHTTSRPVLARRRLYSFDREMSSQKGNIYDWLRESRAEALAVSPPDDLWPDEKMKIQSGVLQSIDKSKVMVSIGSVVHPLDVEGVRFLDDHSGRLFPAAYEPASRRFDGKQIVIRSSGWPPERYSEVQIRVH